MGQGSGKSADHSAPIHPPSSSSSSSSLASASPASSAIIELSEPLLSRCKECFFNLIQKQHEPSASSHPSLSDQPTWTSFQADFLFSDELITAIKHFVSCPAEETTLNWKQFSLLFHTFCSTSSLLPTRRTSYLLMFSAEESTEHLLHALTCSYSLALRFSPDKVDTLLKGSNADSTSLFTAWTSSASKFSSVSEWASEYAQSIGEPLSRWLESRLPSLSEEEAPVASAPALAPFPLFSGRPSSILSPPTLFILYNMMAPACLGRSVMKVIYSNMEDGASMSCISTNLLGYRGPTLLLVETHSNQLWAAYIGSEWRDDTKPQGTSDCALLRIFPSPQYMKSLAAPATRGSFIYFNTHDPRKGSANRSPKGVGLGADPTSLRFFVNGDLEELTVRQRDSVFSPDNCDELYRSDPAGLFTSPIRRIEVLGLGSSESEAAQKQFKKQMERMREQARAVDKELMFGGLNAWKENPDKVLLEMMGKKSYTDQMESEYRDIKSIVLPGSKSSS